MDTWRVSIWVNPKCQNGHQYGQTPPKTDFPVTLSSKWNKPRKRWSLHRIHGYVKMEHMGGYLKLLGFSDGGTKLSCKAQAWVQESTNLSKTTAGFFPHRNSHWKFFCSPVVNSLETNPTVDWSDEPPFLWDCKPPHLSYWVPFYSSPRYPWEFNIHRRWSDHELNPHDCRPGPCI